MRRNHLVLTSLVAGMALASLIYLIGFTGSDPSVPASGNRASKEQPSVDRPSLGQPSRKGADPSLVPRPSAASDPARDDEPSSEPSARAPGEPSRMRRTLQDKFGRPADPSKDEHEQPAAPPALPKEYVKGIVREQLIPLAQSCYEDIAPTGARAKMTMSVVVLGDAEIGGVIDHVGVDAVDAGDIDASVAGDLTECVRQAAYAMEFDAPEDGKGTTEFTFSVAFSSEPAPKKPK